MKLEEYLSGFIQEIDKFPEKRDIYLNFLTDSIDKPYYNISYLNKENNSDKNLTKSAFNEYILLNIDESTINEHVNDQLEEIKEKENKNKGKKNDKKIEEEIEEPDIEILKEDLKKYNSEIPKIFEFLGNFENLKIMNEKDKNEINNKIDTDIINYVKDFEGKINKENNNANYNINFIDDDGFRYFKRLNEIKKIMRKDTSNNIIMSWIENKNKYIFSVKEFIYNVHKLKQDIIKKMNLIQDDFIEYLNSKSDKKKLINSFIEKYEVFMKNFSSIKNNLLVKEEAERDIIELTENLWKIIQLRKKNAINELNNIRNKRFIAQKIEYFSEMLSNLFYSEAEFYLNKVNIIQQFYYEIIGKTNKRPEYRLKKSELMKNTNNLEIYMPPPQKEIKTKKIKPRLKRYEDIKKEYLISPKIDRIYKNCFKLLFNYEKKLKEEGFIIQKKDDYNLFKRKKTKRYDLKKDTAISTYSDKKLINPDLEMQTALNNEKIKYKIRLVFLKFFGEKFLEKLNDIEKITFENMDKWIIKSVDAQNNTMNSIINKIRENILRPSFKEINNVVLNEELDIFNIYEKIENKFNEFEMKNYKLIKQEDKEFDLNELYKIYLDLKLHQIQENYVTFDSLIDIFFKKHIFDYNSKGIMKCFKELPYRYFYRFILKFKIKTNKEQILVRLDKLFTVLSLMNEIIPSKEELEKMRNQAKKSVKYTSYLSKDDFLKFRFWFDNIDIIEKKVERKGIADLYKKPDNWKRRKSHFNTTNKISLNLIKERLDNIKQRNTPKGRSVDKKLTKKNTSFKKDNSNSEVNINESNINKDNKKDLKEILFSINKNYIGDINIFEFFNTISLEYATKIKRKYTLLKIKNKESNVSIENHDEKNKININENESKNVIKSTQTYFEYFFSS